jgi:hypothetical protein
MFKVGNGHNCTIRNFVIYPSPINVRVLNPLTSTDKTVTFSATVQFSALLC